VSRLAPLFSQRVPLYIALPVIGACGVAGYIASTMRPDSTIIDQAQIHQPAEPEPSQQTVATSPVAEQPTTDQKESQRPGVENNQLVPAPPVSVTRAMPERPRANRAVPAASKPRRPQRVARQPTSASATAPTGLKSIPPIGPVFSLLQ
jgi:hypothetical protein